MPKFEPDAVDRNAIGIWRYAEMLPVSSPDHKLCTLGEGWTPLLDDVWAGIPVYWKYDAIMPTGSYKDRGVSVMVNWLLGLGAETLVDDSSGNAGASLACYAARAGLDACIYVPASAPSPKKIQIETYGAELVEVPGPRSAATKAAEAASNMVISVKYASHAWHPAFLLGQMTTAWEVWEQMDREVPDWFVAPVGHGGCLLGIWRGYQHLYNSGIIQKLPKLVAVQAEPFTPIFDAFHEGHRETRTQTRLGPIIADGIAIESPVRAQALLSALRQSGGTAVAVAQTAVLEAHEQMARRGLFVEPTSATVAVALDTLGNQIQAGETVVALITGHGLKNPTKLD